MEVAERRERARVNYAKRKENETVEERDARRLQQTRNKRRQLRDPKAWERHREVSRESQRRRREALGDVFWELRRIDRALMRERDGKPLPSLEKVQSKYNMIGVRLPIGPYREWVEYLISEYRRDHYGESIDSAIARVASILKISSRRMSDRRLYWEDIDYGIVDRDASRQGETTVDEIYRDFGGMTLKYLSDGSYGFAVGTYIARRPRRGDAIKYFVGDRCFRYVKKEEDTKMGLVKMMVDIDTVDTCHSPNCREDISGVSKWCTTHGEILARVKEAMDDDLTKLKSKVGRKDARPTCCNKACRAPRLRTERYCDQCIEDGWDEEALV